MQHPMVVEYLKLLHTENALTGSNGQHISETNPPAWRVGDVSECKFIGVHFCCSEMGFHFRAGHIGFGERPESIYKNKVAEVFVRIAGGPEQDFVLPYCPFCREPVLTREISG